ncbi:hypothetical protein BDQ12DRAFT_725346 [Crucibulum laeve]|uniref:Uncharacterized protein n=1 Tax=Crucibulum laeve TaxID=68775 RepID=A0A5C3LT41_9AGAR|nr:hypothetical protein BDQ12DRAFT_725346 [Crucibulum laeve]
MTVLSHFQLTTRDSTSSVTPTDQEGIIQMLNYVTTAGMVDVLLYGIHVTLFIICLKILYRNRKSNNFLIPVSIIIMFALTTADVGITFHASLSPIFGPSPLLYFVPLIPKFVIFVANNFIADVLLLYRCYVVWGRRREFLYLSIILLLIDIVFGLIGLIEKNSVFLLITSNDSNPVYTWVIVAINITITAVTAGRIYWVARTIEPTTGRKHVRVYKVAVAILIESGLVYSTSVAVFAVSSNLFQFLISGAFCFRLVAIMPTLMTVQVHLGRTVDVDGRGISTGANVQRHSGNQRPAVITNDMNASDIHFRPVSVDGTLQRSSIPGVLERESDSGGQEDIV